MFPLQDCFLKRSKIISSLLLFLRLNNNKKNILIIKKIKERL